MEHKPQNRSSHNILYGAISGLSTIIVTQPLQVIRTSMMVTYMNGKLFGFLGMALHILKNEGVFGFYRGLKPTIIKTPLATAIYFSSLERIKGIISDRSHDLNKNIINFLSSGLARVIQCCAANPLLVVITRYEVAGFDKYQSLPHAFKNIYVEEGVKGYLTGLKPLLWKEVPTASLFYLLYENIKSIMRNLGFTNLTTLATVSASLSNILLTFLNNPFDVMRTRLQYLHISKNDTHDYKGIFQGLRLIYRTEGMRGLFLGIVPRMIKRSLGSSIAWSVFEGLKSRDMKKNL